MLSKSGQPIALEDVVAEVAELPQGWRVQLLQGKYDLPSRRFVGKPTCRAVTELIPNKYKAWKLAEEIASDLGAIDITMVDPN